MNPKEDFVFYRNEKNEVMSGGYKINSILLRNQTPLFDNKETQHDIVGNAIKDNKHKGGSNIAINKIFNDLAVPAGLLFLQQNNTLDNVVKDSNLTMNKNIMSDSLYDKLYNLASNTKIKQSNKTRKYKNKNKKRTRKVKK